MAVFGVLVRHDDDGDRAVRAAFALRAAVAERGAPAPLQLELRIGVNTGEVVAGSGEGPSSWSPVSRSPRRPSS